MSSMTSTVAIPPYLGYVFDLDGTLYLGDQLLPGAAETIARLREDGARVVFVTNKPLETTVEYAAKLTRLGIPCSADEVVSAISALTLYLARNFPTSTILAVAEEVVIDALRDAGYAITDDPEAAEIVVVSFDRTFDYDKLTRAYLAVKHGAQIVATNPDPYCPTPDGGLPDCAAMLAALEACTGAKATAIVGKPSEHMAAAFLDRLGVPADRAVMVGDRLATDVAMGIEAGMASVLVLSGATGVHDLEISSIIPTWVAADVRALVADR